MNKTSKLADTKRRTFLKGSLATATGVAISAMTGESLADTAETAVEQKTGDKDGYRLTRHIAEYYKSAAV